MLKNNKITYRTGFSAFLSFYFINGFFIYAKLIRPRHSSPLPASAVYSYFLTPLIVISPAAIGLTLLFTLI